MIDVGSTVTLNLEGYNKETARLRFQMKSEDEEYYRNLFRDGWAYAVGLVINKRRHARFGNGFQVLWTLSGGSTIRLWHLEEELDEVDVE